MKLILLILFSVCFEFSKCQTINNLPKVDNAGWVEYNYILKSQNELHLQTLLRYTNRTVLRFWRFTNFMSSLTEISKTGVKWDVIKYNFKLHIGQKLSLSNISQAKPSTRVNLDSFLTRVTKLGFDTLAVQDNIKLEDVLVDGVLYCFEFSDKSKYNFYCYSNPISQKDKYPQANIVSAILKELEAVINIQK